MSVIRARGEGLQAGLYNIIIIYNTCDGRFYIIMKTSTLNRIWMTGNGYLRVINSACVLYYRCVCTCARKSH